jgi:Cys-tRNA synthase (O-phospho-L-seryl-tRNA:Cys-tRNA synthase)
MTLKKKKIAETANLFPPANRRVRIKRSPLRGILDEMLTMSPLALQNLKDSLEGKKIDSDVLSSSKYIVDRCASYTTAVHSEEANILKTKVAAKNYRKEVGLENDEYEAQLEDVVEDTPKPQRFSLTMLKGNKED